MQAIVLAGGLGTRLRSRVADRPKSLALVAGRPFLEYLLDWLESGRYRHVVLATGHQSEMIESHFGNRYKGLTVSYSCEHVPLGTGGAVVKALEVLPDEPTLVMNGDTWLGLDLPKFIGWCDDRPGCDAIVLRQVVDASRFACVKLDGDLIVEFGAQGIPGPGMINAGVYLVRRDTFKDFGLGPSFSIENDFFRRYAAELGLRGFVTTGHFIDIGVPQDFDRAQVELQDWIANR